MIGQKPNTPCELWTGAVGTDGYGVISNYKARGHGALLRAHRVAYESVHGPIPRGLSVLHACDNPLCVNVEHLWIGTRKENNDDKTAKDRIPFGDVHWNAKLTAEKVREARGLRRSGRTYSWLADRYGVNIRTINEAVTGKTWRRA